MFWQYYVTVILQAIVILGAAHQIKLLDMGTDMPVSESPVSTQLVWQKVPPFSFGFNSEMSYFPYRVLVGQWRLNVFGFLPMSIIRKI